MSPKQYVKAIGESQSYNSKQAVNYRIRQGLKLYGVIRVENILGRNVLYVSKLKLSKLKICEN